MCKFTIKADELAYWYLRLNGFLTTDNFIVHDEKHPNQRTDVDILGVRFPYRNEINMSDDDFFINNNKKPLYVISEATKGTCKLNGPWTSKDKGNMQRVLRSIGAFKEAMIEVISDSLYALGYYENEEYRVNLICIGKEYNQVLSEKYPKVPQFLFNDILKFMHKRFKEFHEQKQVHQQWDENGKGLWNHYDTNRNDIVSFKKSIEIT